MVRGIWQRARQPEQKEQRRSEILASAAELFEEVGLDRVSLSAIARQAGISKANIYRYFESREEIFLHLMRQDNAEWVTAVEARLAPLAGSGSIEATARELTESLFEHSRLAALTAVTSSILEHNVSEDVVVDFKTDMLALVIRLTNALHAALPSLSVANAQEFLPYMYVVQTGLWPVSHPSPVVANVLQRPEFRGFCLDWRRDFERMMILLLRGMLAES